MNVGILPNVNFTKQNRDAKPEISVCFRITRLMNNHMKSRKRATFQEEEKATTRMQWLLRKVCHNWVVYHKIQMHSFLKVGGLGETRCKKSWDQIEEFHSVYATSSKYPGKQRTIAWKNSSQTSSSAKSLRYEI